MLRYEDIGLIKTGMLNQSLDSSIGDLFPLFSPEDLISKSLRLLATTWIIVCDSLTGISASYLLHILATFSPVNTIIGRFGCIPTSELASVREFKLCHKYPILKSGFVFSTDLAAQFQLLPNVSLEYSIGLSFSNATFYDDFRFHFLAANSSSRGTRFAVSFWPFFSSMLENKYFHASGLNVSVMLSPFVSGEAVLGGNLYFLGNLVQTRDFVEIRCGNFSEEMVKSLFMYLNRIFVEVKCFDEAE
jgi:hypothetical protein